MFIKTKLIMKIKNKESEVLKSHDVFSPSFSLSTFVHHLATQYYSLKQHFIVLFYLSYMSPSHEIDQFRQAHAVEAGGLHAGMPL